MTIKWGGITMKNININEQILPLGSVIITREGHVPLMIVSRGSLYEEEDKIGYFDYCALVYPMGLIDDHEFVFFNKEDIESVLFIGYITKEEEDFAKKYDELIAESGYDKLHII